MERLADQRFTVPHAVCGRGIDACDARIYRCVDCFYRIFIIRAAPEPASDGPGAETDRGKVEPGFAELLVLHWILL